MSGALLSTPAVVVTFWPQARPARILMQFLYGTSQLWHCCKKALVQNPVSFRLRIKEPGTLLHFNLYCALKGLTGKIQQHWLAESALKGRVHRGRWPDRQSDSSDAALDNRCFAVGRCDGVIRALKMHKCIRKADERKFCCCYCSHFASLHGRVGFTI